MNNTKQELRRVPLKLIDPSPYQARKTFKTADWPEFVESIKTSGVVQPAVAREMKGGRIQLVCGERRFRASEELKLPKLPCILRELTDAEAQEIVAIENLQREGLNPLEEAQGYADWITRLMSDPAKGGQGMKTRAEAIAHIESRVKRKRAAIYERLSLVNLSKPVKQAVTSGELEPSKAALFAAVPAELHQRLLKEAQGDRWNGPMSVRELRSHIDEEYTRQLGGVGWKLDDATLVKDAGPCSTCPKRSGNIEGMTGNQNICTDVKCFECKQGQQALRALQAAKAAGQRTISGEEYEKRSYDYVPASDKPWQDKKGRTWNQLGAAANITPAVTINRQGEAINVFTPEDKRKIFKVNKLASNSSSSSAYKPTAAELKRRAEQKAKDDKMEAAMTTMCLTAAAASDKPTLEFFKKLARTAALGADYGGFDEKVYTTRGMNPEDKRGEAVILEEYISKQVSVDNLVSLIVHLLTCGLGTYGENGGEAGRAMLVWGVDWKKEKGTALISAKPAKAKGSKKK